MSFLLISDNNHRTATLGAADRAMFRADALEVRMYYVPEGETILVTRGQDALLMEGGSGRALRNPTLAQAIAGRASGAAGAANFAPGALYFDNGIFAGFK